ncbi:hypothetical protein NFI96_028272, partial [Prochilodus magdalenae]
PRSHAHHRKRNTSSLICTPQSSPPQTSLVNKILFTSPLDDSRPS